jgi:hypothetical protein
MMTTKSLVLILICLVFLMRRGEGRDAQVKVEIIERIPDETSWRFQPGDSSETYFEEAFGFGTMPTRYSEKGIKTDRSAPFLFRATATLALPKGNRTLLMRAHTGARLFIDDQEVLSTPFPNFIADGHEEVPETPQVLSPDIRYLRPGHFESFTNFLSDGQSHTFKLEALIGLKERRPELGELLVAIAPALGSTFYLLSAPATTIALTETSFDKYLKVQHQHWKEQDVIHRHEISHAEDDYWNKRHQRAREIAKKPSSEGTIDGFINARLQTANIAPGPLTDDYTFIRRLALDTVGVIPAPELVRAFADDRSGGKRARMVDRFLRQPGWADHWVSYWQDVLAENPGILKPMLNNTGPFRWWIHESFIDNKAMDRFVTELIMMEGSKYYGGPAGFGMATDNDVPMAQKAQIVAQAFMGLQMQCARCHDAPHHDFKQKDLFSLAAMLKRGTQIVPPTSSIPTNSHGALTRKVKVTLPPGGKVEPAWPFENLLAEGCVGDGVLRNPSDSRERLAALVTDPANPRFARVLVNRVWKRYLGWGLVEPVDDWETAKPSHPELLDFLAWQLVTHDYDLQYLARLILNSDAYQREVRAEGSEEHSFESRFFATPARRRLTAEQLVDSLFFAAGKSFDSEELNMDVDSRRPVKDFNNLGYPVRAWEFTSLSNERDRPALSIPKSQAIVDALSTFGWRDSRQNSATVRDDSANIVQPALLANGILAHGRIAKFSDEGVFTQLALQERPLSEFVRSLFFQVLSRPPTAEELAIFSATLGPGYETRRNLEFGKESPPRQTSQVRAVSWANHLNPEATRIKQEQEHAARLGDAPGVRLKKEWRARAEDAVWALINSPEFVFVP